MHVISIHNSRRDRLNMLHIILSKSISQKLQIRTLLKCSELSTLLFHLANIISFTQNCHLNVKHGWITDHWGFKAAVGQAQKHFSSVSDSGIEIQISMGI